MEHEKPNKRLRLDNESSLVETPQADAKPRLTKACKLIYKLAKRQML